MIKKILQKFRMYSYFKSYADKQKAIKDFLKWDEEDERRLQFYKQFIKAEDVVFDVGANLGNRTKIFLKLNAKVIAFEPQEKCIQFLEKMCHGNDNFILEKKALGGTEGETEMLISNAHMISSLSPQWIDAVKKSGRFSEYQWKNKQHVEITTLDKAIEKNGQPVFIKIDVEGFESEVLSGLSIAVPCLSIEFTPEYMQNTYQCIDYLETLATYEFQYSLEESMTFALSQWVSSEDIKEKLSKLDKKWFGDVYCRRK